MNFRTLLSAFFVSALSVFPLLGDEVLSEDFSTTESGRAKGTPIDGLSLRQGNVEWIADPGFVLDESDSLHFATLTLEGQAMLGVPFSFAEVVDKGEVVTVIVTVLNLDTTAWVAINFGSKVKVDDFFPTTKAWALLQPNGRWEIRDGYTFDQEPSILAEGDITLPNNTSVQLSFSYNESTSEIVDFSINGNSVASNMAFQSVRSWPINAISIKALKAKAGFGIGSFKVFVTKSGQPLPQP